MPLVEELDPLGRPFYDELSNLYQSSTSFVDFFSST